MGFVKTFQLRGSEYAECSDGKNRKIKTYYGRYIPGEEKPTDGMRGADRLVYTNWNRLSAEEQAAAGAQVWIFDEDSREWDPL